MPPRQWMALAALCVAAVGASLWYGQSAPDPAPLLTEPANVAGAAPITVHVSGEVAAPGLVAVESGARVADAIAAAGGSTRTADLQLINLAAELHDGQQIVIPPIGSTTVGGGVAADGTVHINSATVAELEQLPGVGPVLAGRIAAYRDENGPFVAVEDLLDVSGIGEGKLETLRDSVALP